MTGEAPTGASLAGAMASRGLALGCTGTLARALSLRLIANDVMCASYRELVQPTRLVLALGPETRSAMLRSTPRATALTVSYPAHAPQFSRSSGHSAQRPMVRTPGLQSRQAQWRRLVLRREDHLARGSRSETL
jgi:hypothetical protein